MRVTVFVMPKRTVLDPQGKAVRHAMESLGFADVGEVRIGKRIDFDLAADDNPRTRQRIDQICRELLSNPVIEDFEYTVESAAAVEV